jgi:NAD(P)-dependent dehydrogenase (short-subunit alcohol dehydrogenase family)
MPERYPFVNMLADDAVVVMTGAAGGLGGAMTRGLLRAGRRVVAVDVATAREPMALLEADARALGADGRLHSVVGDIRSEADCERAVGEGRKRFGAVHALVNNAGIGMSALSLDAQDCKVPFYKLPAEFWRTLFDINVNGSFLMARAVAPHLVAQGYGRIVNVTTGIFTMVRGGFTPYGPAKAADTPMVPHASVADRSTLVAPHKMVAPVVWLTSSASDGVTGMRIIGNDWDEVAPASDNLAKSARAGWRR